MKWFDLHTHRVTLEIDTISIFNATNCDDVHDQKYVSLGLHPWSLTTLTDSLLQLEKVKKWSLERYVVALGECGLDKICKVDFELQRQLFEMQIEWSEEIKKPMIIHCVKAFDELIAMRKRMKPKQTWIIHGFRGNPIQSEQLISNGFLLSFGEKFNEKTIKSVPLSSVFIETDESALSVELVYEKIAQTKEVTIDELKVQMWKNANVLFPIIDLEINKTV